MTKLLPVDPAPLSDWRAHYWLRRSQMPAACTADLIAWCLGADADPGAVLSRALALPDDLPALAEGFRLGTLDLETESRPAPAPVILHAPSVEAALQTLLTFQAHAHDPGRDSPFRVCLILIPDDAILGLRVERLAGGDDLVRQMVARLCGHAPPEISASGPPVYQRQALDWMARSTPAAIGEIAATRLPLPSGGRLLDHAGAALRAALGELGCPSDCRVGILPDAASVVLARAAAEHDGGAGIAIGLLAADEGFPDAPSARRIAVPPLPDETTPGIMLGLRPGQDDLAVELSCGSDHAPGLARLLLDRLAAHWTAPRADRVPPAVNDVAALILGEFRIALGAPEMAADDDFFDLGGHSLTATRIVGRLASQHGISIRFEDVFARPTARKLALCAGTQAPPSTPMAAPQEGARDGGGDAPLSLAQASLWKVYAALGKGDIFNIPFGLRFLAPVDERAFGAAFRDLLIRHDILRSLFVEDAAGVVRQSPVAPDRLDQFDWFWRSEDSTATSRAEEARHVFDLSRELPLRLRFLREDGAQVLSLLFHHVVLDEWSVDLMMNDLAVAYLARSSGQPPVWADAPPPFADFARGQAQAGPGAAHLAWWVEMLRDPPPRRPFVAGRPEHAGQSRPDGGWREIAVPADVGEGLYQSARACGASLFNIVYAAIGAALRDVSGQDDLIIGTSAAGRGDPRFFETVGYFTTVAAHRLRLSVDASPRMLTEQVRDLINGSLPHDDIPIDMVEAAIGHPGPEHLFEAFIQIHAGNRMNGALTGADGREIAFRQIDPEKTESLLGLQFEVVEDVIDDLRRLRVMMSYRTDSYGPGDVDRLQDAVSDMFARFADPGLADIPLGAMA